MDYAAATPVRNQVRKVMGPFFSKTFANPSAIHQEGVAAREAIEMQRVRLARVLKARPEGVYFTGSGTESNNLAILGVFEKKHKDGRAYADMEVVSTKLEHPSVLEALRELERRGVVVRYVEVDEEGVIKVEALKAVLTEKTVLVTFAYINSEIGVMQEVGKIARAVRAFEKDKGTRVYVHTDAAQAPLWASCELDHLLVDIVSLDAGKCYGPKGVGVLVLRRGVEIAPVLFGGPQEGGLRPATENTPAVVGAVEAIVIAQERHESLSQTVCKLRDFLAAELLKINGVVLNGSKEHRVANNVNVSVRGVDGEYAVVVLDEAGIACSTRSACSGATGAGSSVVMAISGDQDRASSSIRFTLGEETTRAELQKAADVLAQHVEKTRTAMNSLTQ